MPKRSLSVLKRARQSQKRRLRNVAVKSAVKTAIKKAREAITAKDVETAQAALKQATKLLDKAASKGIIHQNTAARKKSRITKQFNSLKTT